MQSQARDVRAAALASPIASKRVLHRCSLLANAHCEFRGLPPSGALHGPVHASPKMLTKGIACAELEMIWIINGMPQSDALRPAIGHGPRGKK